MKGFFSILGLFLPHFFAATLSHRQATDKRMLKYFLPYGYMKKRMKYVFHANVGNDKKDHGVAGVFRWCCPYGIVLWWDGGRDAAPCASPAGNIHCHQPRVDDLNEVRQWITSLRQEVVDRSENLELLMLRFIDSKAIRRGSEDAQ